MREILFRGRKADGKWVYGDLNRDPIMGLFFVEPPPYDGHSEVVDGSTVGQFTGLLDKNGARIFEGDVLEGKAGRKMLVFWNEGVPGFFLSRFSEDRNRDPICDLQIKAFELVVIGNIHDTEVHPHAD